MRFTRLSKRGSPRRRLNWTKIFKWSEEGRALLESLFQPFEGRISVAQIGKSNRRLGLLEAIQTEIEVGAVSIVLPVWL